MSNWKIKKLYAKGDVVVCWNIVTGTHEGKFQGIPATGSKISVGSIIIYRFNDGKIVELREEADMMGLMQQLGMKLKPKEKE